MDNRQLWASSKILCVLIENVPRSGGMVVLKTIMDDCESGIDLHGRSECLQYRDCAVQSSCRCHIARRGVHR